MIQAHTEALHQHLFDTDWRLWLDSMPGDFTHMIADSSSSLQISPDLSNHLHVSLQPSPYISPSLFIQQLSFNPTVL